MSQLITSISDGTLTITGGTITGATSAAIDTITEATLDHGVDLELVHFEDGNISNITSIDTALVTSTNITDMTMSGFQSWGGSGDYYSIAGTAPAVFSLLRPGTGYIKSAPISFTATQTVNLVANSINFIVIDSNGLIQALTTIVGSTYENYIGLFEVMFDGTVNYLTKKENHPYKFQTTISVFIHNNIGPIVRGSGANLAVGTTNTKLKIVGDDVIEDHGLYTNITGADPITIRYYYINSSGKWIYYSTSDIVPAYYNQTPSYTPTALTGNQRAVFRIYVILDDLNSTSPIYMGVMHAAASPFANLSAANTAINAGTISGATNELYSVEPVQLGYAVVNNNSGSPYVEEVIIQKNTAKAQYSSGSVGGDHLLLANINGGQYGMGGHTGVAQRYISAASAPTADDDIDSYLKGCVWIKEDTDDIYINTDNTDTTAVWRKMLYDNMSSATITTINSTTANAGTTNTRLVLNNSSQRKITAIGSATVLDNTHNVILASTTVASYNITLPAANAYSGIEYTVIYASKTAAYTVSVVRAGADTIDGILTSYTLTDQYDKIKFMSDGTSIWYTNV